MLRAWNKAKSKAKTLAQDADSKLKDKVCPPFYVVEYHIYNGNKGHMAVFYDLHDAQSYVSARQEDDNDEPGTDTWSRYRIVQVDKTGPFKHDAVPEVKANGTRSTAKTYVKNKQCSPTFVVGYYNETDEWIDSIYFSERWARARVEKLQGEDGERDSIFLIKMTQMTADTWGVEGILNGDGEILIN